MAYALGVIRNMYCLFLANFSEDLLTAEAGVERLEHLLWPFWFGVDNAIAQQYKAKRHNKINETDISCRINDVIDLIAKCGTVAA